MKNPRFFVTASVICGLVFMSGSSYAGRLNSSSANNYERGIQASKMAHRAVDGGMTQRSGAAPNSSSTRIDVDAQTDMLSGLIDLADKEEEAKGPNVKSCDRNNSEVVIDKKTNQVISNTGTCAKKVIGR